MSNKCFPVFKTKYIKKLTMNGGFFLRKCLVALIVCTNVGYESSCSHMTDYFLLILIDQIMYSYCELSFKDKKREIKNLSKWKKFLKRFLACSAICFWWLYKHRNRETQFPYKFRFTNSHFNLQDCFSPGCKSIFKKILEKYNASF